MLPKPGPRNLGVGRSCAGKKRMTLSLKGLNSLTRRAFKGSDLLDPGNMQSEADACGESSRKAFWRRGVRPRLRCGHLLNQLTHSQPPPQRHGRCHM